VTIRWIGKQHNYYFHGIFLHSLKIQPKWRLRKSRGVRGAVWFGFDHKSHPNRNIKKHAVRFGSVDF
jgi:hypothetical protein